MTRHYRTAAGSTVTISGKHAGVYEIDFDWFEEGACCEARCSATVNHDPHEPALRWECECCGSGSAPLVKCEVTGTNTEPSHG